MQKSVSIYHAIAKVMILPTDGKVYESTFTFDVKTEKDYDKQLNDYVKQSNGTIKNAMRIEPIKVSFSTFKVDATKLLDFLFENGRLVTPSTNGETEASEVTAESD